MTDRTQARRALSEFWREFRKAQRWHLKLVAIRKRAEELAVLQVKCVREANVFHRKLKSLRRRQDRRLRVIGSFLSARRKS